MEHLINFLLRILGSVMLWGPGMVLLIVLAVSAAYVLYQWIRYRYFEQRGDPPCPKPKGKG